MTSRRCTLTRGRHTYTYGTVRETQIPPGRWHVPGQYAGQSVERAWRAVGGTAGEAGLGDEWMRVTDHSDGSVTYWRLVHHHIAAPDVTP